MKFHPCFLEEPYRAVLFCKNESKSDETRKAAAAIMAYLNL
jgi:hypothetical protein